jgi:segregation and condensation protein B
LNQRTKSELSQPALETLAIIAYRQPITKSQIESLRGVASDQTLRNLLGRGLIVEDGHADLPGKPRLYRTNTTFLQLFGLTRPQDLPDLPGENEA